MKHLLTATLIATALASPARADELFGYQLFTDIRSYHKDLSGATQSPHTSAPFNEIFVDPIIYNASFSEYSLDYSSENFLIHTVLAAKHLLSMDYCAVEMENWVPRLESRFGVNLTYYEWQNAGISSLAYSADKGGASISVRCDQWLDDGDVEISILWRSDELWDEISRGFDEF